MNIVVDTNVLISAVLWKGPPSDALKIILEKYILVQSQSTLKEFEKVIAIDKHGNESKPFIIKNK